MFHIYNGTSNPAHVEHCYPNGSRMPPQHPPEHQHQNLRSNNPAATQAPSLNADWRDHQISVSNSLSGPWTLLQPAPGNALPACNNPAPWAHPNGTLYSLCSGRIITADVITGPWRNVSKVQDANWIHEWPKGWHHEDPFLFTTKRGWHILFHASVPANNSPGAGLNCTDTVVSAHMFSVDGFDWHASSVSPYSSQVEVEQPVAFGVGSEIRVMTVATRERPKLIFDDNGDMTHLINGVCGSPSCTDSPKTGCVDCKYHHWDFTLIQPIRRTNTTGI
eukprot:m.263397 g.263397  ORF g.263397 m.263397 type:complete len:277 (-) comp50329_c0_seq1:26-856(-)